MTREEILQRARDVQLGRSRSWVMDAGVFAKWILDVLEPERHLLQGEIDRLHDRCSDLLEMTARLNEQISDLKREIPTEPDMRRKR
jgi:hypothetical protein